MALLIDQELDTALQEVRELGHNGKISKLVLIDALRAVVAIIHRVPADVLMHTNDPLETYQFPEPIESIPLKKE